MNENKFGDGSGNVELGDESMSQARAEWRLTSVSLSSYPGGEGAVPVPTRWQRFGRFLIHVGEYLARD